MRKKYSDKELKNLLESSHPAFYCSNCSVLRCWKAKDGKFHFFGSIIDTTEEICHKKKREYLE